MEKYMSKRGVLGTRSHVSFSTRPTVVYWKGRAETVADFALIINYYVHQQLANVSDVEADKEYFHNVLLKWVYDHCHHAGCVTQNYDHFEAAYDPNIRNVTLSFPELNSHVIYRFTGHTELQGNFMGISTLRSEAVLAELRSRVNTEQCRNKKRVIVVQSSYHDPVLTDLQHSRDQLDEILTWVETVTLSSTTTRWRACTPRR
jgi:hypothetical protein